MREELLLATSKSGRDSSLSCDSKDMTNFAIAWVWSMILCFAITPERKGNPHIIPIREISLSALALASGGEESPLSTKDSNRDSLP